MAGPVCDGNTAPFRTGNVITAPSEAIQMGQSGYFAYVVRNDSTVEVRNVVPGETRTT